MWSFRYWHSAAGRFAAVTSLVPILIVVALSLVFANTAVWAQCGSCSGGSSGHSQHGSSSHDAATDHSSHADHGMPGYGGGADGTLVRQPREAPHGGQITATEWHHFEAVYTPKETRIFVYSPSMQRMDTRGVRGQLVMQVRGNPQLFRYPVKEAADGPGMHYLSVPVDVSRIRDGDMLVTYDLSNLPFREEPKVQFSQLFALTRAPGAVPGPRTAVPNSPAAVRVVALTDADRPLIARQRTCPVLGSALGDHGDPVKLLVHGQPLFVCCQGCIDKIKQNPDRYVQKASSAPVVRQPQAHSQYGRPMASLSDMEHAGPPRAPQILVTKATVADQGAIRAQKTCPVMNTQLGSHGTPVKILVDGKPLFVCCQGCVNKVKKTPDLYLAKIAKPVRRF